jgi:hypothetical protein
MLRTALLSFLLAVPLWAQTKELDLRPDDGWVDTGVDLAAGDSVRVTADGQLQYSNAKQHITPADPVLKAKTATGSEFTSDGRTLLVYFAATGK